MPIDFEGKIRELQNEIDSVRSRIIVEEADFKRQRKELLSQKKEKLDLSAERRRLNEELHQASENKKYCVMRLSGRDDDPPQDREVFFAAWPERHYRDYPTCFLQDNPKLHAGCWDQSFDEFMRVRPLSLVNLLLQNTDLLVTADSHFNHIEPLDQKVREDLEKTFLDKLIEVESINSGIDQENSQIEDKINVVKSGYEEQTKELETNKGRLEHQINYLQRAQRALSNNPVIRKYTAGLDDRPFYSIWLETSPVFLYSGGRLWYLHTSRKDQPLQLVSASIDDVIGPENTRLAGMLLGLEEDKFCTDQGYTLEGEAERFAADRFEQVMTGVEILPSEDSPDGYKIIQRRNGEPHPDQPRHWGQVHLVQLRPDRIVTGELLGSGGSYKAYVFGDKTVVEFDQEKRATYLFETGYFENLRVWKRSRILENNPAGFEGRIIHAENKELWREQIGNFLR